ncbi:MAG: pirin family protein [Bacteroidota bacterium]
MITVYPKSHQAKGAFNGGAILENKPVGFPGEGGRLQPYSNLFYWAHAWSEEGSTIGLHPHKGFEIMSFVTKGELEHFDTKHNEWIPLKAGSAQIIRSGQGISHAEKLNAGCHIFQIWFDPGLQQSMQKSASYDDYGPDDIPVTEKNGVKIKWYKGGKGPVKMDTYDVVIKELTFEKGSCSMELDTTKIHGWYLVEGELMVNWQEMEVDDFALIRDFEDILIETTVRSKVFVVESPIEVPYATYSALRK